MASPRNYHVAPVFPLPVNSRYSIACLSLCALLALALAAAHARGTKAIWGPAKNASDQPNPGASLFPTYKQLGVDVYQFQIPWNEVAPTRPADPRNPADPAYNWSSIYDFIVSEAAANSIALAAQRARQPTLGERGPQRDLGTEQSAGPGRFHVRGEPPLPVDQALDGLGRARQGRLLPAPGSEEVPQALREAARGRLPGAEAGEREQHRDRRHDPQRRRP